MNISRTAPAVFSSLCGSLWLCYAMSSYVLPVFWIVSTKIMYLGFKLSLFSFMLMCTGNLAYSISDVHVCWVIELVLEMPCYSMLFQPSNPRGLITLYLTDSPGPRASWSMYPLGVTKYVHLFDPSSRCGDFVVGVCDTLTVHASWVALVLNTSLSFVYVAVVRLQCMQFVTKTSYQKN